MFKDFENSPTTGFETVKLRGGAFALSQMRLAVNFYSGSVQAKVSGELRIAIGDRVWAKSFEIGARTGDRGAGAERAIADGEVPNSAWIILDPMEILSD